MFNMTILDVAIGMVFIYLLLSLMCSAANEIIELLLKKRAIDLERGIRELLVPGSASGTEDVVQKLYNHPLVNGLFGGKYEDSRIASAKRYVMRTALPSYIPSRTFALALMDLVLPPTPGTPAVAPAMGVAAAPAVLGEASGAAGATPPSAQADVKITLTEPPADPLAPTAPGNPLLRLRDAVGSNALLNDHAKNALTTLIDAAGDDVAKARENIEGWYDNSMDRVSSWYKRRTQVVLMILGLFIAITMNVDTITVVKRLSTDRALRESLVAAADAYSKANSESASKAENPPAQQPTPSVASEQRTKNREEACKDPNSESHACVSARELEETCKDENSPKCKYVLTQQQIQSLGLPIGWDDKNDPNRNIPTWSGLVNFFKWLGGQFLVHWLGWLLTALAISLGAPFWFDLLNKFMAVRGAVKPGKTSPDATT